MAKRRAAISGSVTTKARQKLGDLGDIDTVPFNLGKEGAIERAVARATFPSSVPLILKLQTTDKGKTTEKPFDFSELHQQCPECKLIINQFVHGLQLVTDPAKSYCMPNIRKHAIIEFIEYLNAHQKDVTSISKIITAHHLGFKQYINDKFPKRTVNNKRLNSIEVLINSLRSRYPDTPEIGCDEFIPCSGSKSEEKSTEGYFTSQMRTLRDKCIVDMSAVMKLHTIYNSINDDCEKITVNTPAPPNKPPANDEEAYRLLRMTLASAKAYYPEYPFEVVSSKVAEGYFNPDTMSETSAVRGRKLPTCYRIGQYLKYCSTNLPENLRILGINQGQELLHAAMHFTHFTLYPFLLHTLIYSGLNIETAMCLSDDLSKHISPSLHEPHKYVTLHSYKGRIDEAQSITCSKKGRYSIYGILKYIESIVTRYKPCAQYQTGSIWQFLPKVYKGKSGQKVNIVNNFREKTATVNTASINFISRHGLHDIGLTEKDGNGMNHRRVRSGYVTLLQRHGHNELAISRALKHKNLNTTMNHYLSDNSSYEIFDESIAKIQKLYVDDITNFNIRIIESRSLQKLREAINRTASDADRRKRTAEIAIETGLSEQVITNLMSANSDTYILACVDSRNPDWPGCNEILKNQTCNFFNKCCLCNQAVVFLEAIPYIAKRLLDLEELKSDIPSAEWCANYGDEYDAWQAILERVSDRSLVDDAWQVAQSGDVLLPKIMRGGA